MEKLKGISVLVGVSTGLFWSYLPKGSYYIGISILIFLLCLFVFRQNKKSFFGFLLFSYSINNLMDELFFDNTVIGLNELALLLIIPIIWLLKYRENNV